MGKGRVSEERGRERALGREWHEEKNEWVRGKGSGEGRPHSC